MSEKLDESEIKENSGSSELLYSPDKAGRSVPAESTDDSEDKAEGYELTENQENPDEPYNPAKMRIAVFCRSTVSIYEKPAQTEETEQGTVSAISDEGLYGMPCRILEEREDGWLRILTHYGYTGYVRCEDLIPLTAEDQEMSSVYRMAVIDNRVVDVMSIPSVEGVCLISLGGGSIVKTLPGQCGKRGWMKVRLLDGQEGYLRTQFLEEKRFTEDYLYQDEAIVTQRLSRVAEERRTAPGGQPGFSLQRILDQWYDGSEEEFRRNLTAEAEKYLGTQYRWGGKSFEGIDCSGLVSMAYMRSGVLIYRDASIVSGYPVKRLYSVCGDVITVCAEECSCCASVNGAEKMTSGSASSVSFEQMLASLKEGDLLYFPGHIAMYIGNGKYIHSTARIGSGGVVINSMREEDEDYRQDLREMLYAVGGLR